MTTRLPATWARAGASGRCNCASRARCILWKSSSSTMRSGYVPQTKPLVWEEGKLRPEFPFGRALSAQTGEKPLRKIQQAIKLIQQVLLRASDMFDLTGVKCKYPIILSHQH